MAKIDQKEMNMKPIVFQRYPVKASPSKPDKSVNAMRSYCELSVRIGGCDRRGRRGV